MCSETHANFPLCAGGHSENHEDEEGSEASTASGRGAEPALIAVQTQSPRHQGQLFLFYKSSPVIRNVHHTQYSYLLWFVLSFAEVH